MTFATFDRVIRMVSTVVLGAIIIIGFAMLGISWAHVFCRYVLNDSLTWSEELLKILIVWFCLLSASFISVRREHVSIVVFKQLFPKNGQRAANLLVSLLMLTASAAMCYIGWRLSVFAGIRRTPALKVPLKYTYASLYVSFGIMAFYELRNFLVDCFRPNDTSPALGPQPDALDAPLADTAGLDR